MSALRTDHINLLIFRYLQESGFENAAIAFHRDWQRSAEFNDPEKYSFAQAVERNELVSVIQTALHHDQLLVSKFNRGRQFKWIASDGRESTERRDGAIENGTASRPPSSKGHKGRPSIMRAPDEFPVPAPKRQRRSEASDANLNGDRDAMDVDPAPGDTDPDEDPEAVSPAVNSEPEFAEQAARYDSMDVATQTEVKTSPKTSTMYWNVDKPGASVYHVIWNPDSDPKNGRTLLAAGPSLSRFYNVPESMDDTKQVSHVEVPSFAPDYEITASAWRPDGRCAIFATDNRRNVADEQEITTQQLAEYHRDGPLNFLRLEPPSLESAAIILSLHYSPDAQNLLIIRTNATRGLIQIWKTPASDSEPGQTEREPVAWRMFENPVSDVAWIEDDTFLVCGDQGLSAIYQVDGSQQDHAMIDGIAPATVEMRGLISRNSDLLGQTHKWEKVRFDQRHHLAVFASAEARKLLITTLQDRRRPKSEDDAKDEVTLDLPEEELMSLALCPWVRPEDAAGLATDRAKPSLLAMGFADGSCIIYGITQSPESGPRCIEYVNLSLIDGPAAALAWSPNGQHIAIGNAELVKIWTSDSLKRKNGERHVAKASIVWKPVSEANGTLNGEQGVEQQEQTEPSLSWSADGESLAFAADKQIAVIRFRPPLQTEAQEVEVNGRPSP